MRAAQSLKDQIAAGLTLLAFVNAAVSHLRRALQAVIVHNGLKRRKERPKLKPGGRD